MPPSARMGTPYCLASFATLYTAEACALPQAHTSWVVQMEPMPIPTRSASAPHSMRFFACCFVTTLPATTCRAGNWDLIHLTISCWKTLSPWLLSMTTASTPAATNARTRSLSLGRVPIAAATNRDLLTGSLVALGNSTFFLMSVLETMAMNKPDLVTMGSFPFLDVCKREFACRRSQPSSIVTRSLVGVMMALSRVWRSRTKSVSRFVTRPRSLAPVRPVSVTGKPVKPCFVFKVSNSANVIVGGTQTGSRMKPALYFFTRATSFACSSIGRLVWMTPMPPSRAIAIAMLDSVTVSMGLDTIGVLRAIFRVN
mmetsp:Transcript_46329/g.86522  ORF Transcript_46329/g.86522 Transcript_46329/m.86522 type:complete len:313 (+) Transcript_46329:551-1489(+)